MLGKISQASKQKKKSSSQSIIKKAKKKGSLQPVSLRETIYGRTNVFGHLIGKHLQ